MSTFLIYVLAWNLDVIKVLMWTMHLFNLTRQI